MNIKLLLGIGLILIGIVLAGFGIASIGSDDTRPLIESAQNTSAPLADVLRRVAVPTLAGLTLAVGALLVGLSLGNWKQPRVHLEPGDEVVNPEGYHKMKHV
jgi:uncharacterized protein (UPF0333 family)